MSEKKFKVGDRVRMKRTVCIDYATFPKGTEGKVTSVDDDFAVHVTMVNAEDGKRRDWYCCNGNLELVHICNFGKDV